MLPATLSIPLAALACPVTKEPLQLRDGALHSSFGRFEIDEQHGFPRLIPTPLLDSAEWKTWHQLQENGLVGYREDPKSNLGVGQREDFTSFARFCGFSGQVLDVFVGPQKCPSHFEFWEDKTVSFVGVDPLVGDQPRDFAFVQGLAEYLPFADHWFDQVLFVTSLDHFIDPRPALREARRVVKPGGSILIWIGEKDKSAPRPARSADWYERLQVPPGAEDRFHFKRFTMSELEFYMQQIGLRVENQEVHEVDAWRKNIFFKVRP
jgi:SAM-dependent methyltransferase